MNILIDAQLNALGAHKQIVFFVQYDYITANQPYVDGYSFVYPQGDG